MCCNISLRFITLILNGAWHSNESSDQEYRVASSVALFLGFWPEQLPMSPACERKIEVPRTNRLTIDYAWCNFRLNVFNEEATSRIDKARRDMRKVQSASIRYSYISLEFLKLQAAGFEDPFLCLSMPCIHLKKPWCSRILFLGIVVFGAVPSCTVSICPALRCNGFPRHVAECIKADPVPFAEARGLQEHRIERICTVNNFNIS